MCEIGIKFWADVEVGRLIVRSDATGFRAMLFEIA